MKVKIYFFNLQISVTVSGSALMQCELHLLDTIERSMRNQEAEIYCNGTDTGGTVGPPQNPCRLKGTYSGSCT